MAITESLLHSRNTASVGLCQMLIDGEPSDAADGDIITVENPATGEQIGTIPAGKASDVDRAVMAARKVLEKGAWRNITGAERAAVLWRLSDLILENRDDLAMLDTLDNGMPLVQARSSVAKGAEGLRYYAGLCTKLHGRTANVGQELEFHAYSRLEPVGVAGLITPWNAPISSACGKLAPALASGCSVVLKPAEQTSLSALRIGELAMEAGVPQGALNIVTGVGLEAGAALAAHPFVNALSFTGSTVVGKAIIAAAAVDFKRLTLELGGKSAVFILDDADLDRAVTDATMAAFANSGQLCFAGSRLYIQSGVYEAVLQRVVDFARNLKLGNGLDETSQLGPLISEMQRQRVQDYVASGIAEGATLVTGGKRVDGPGYFFEPTIFACPSDDIRIAREEIFGPVLSVLPFDDVDHIPALANASPYGLGAGIFTGDLAKAHRIAANLEAGNVWINCYSRTDKALPFGGYKQSGVGRENGFEGIEVYLEKKAIYARL